MLQNGFPQIVHLNSRKVARWCGLHRTHVHNHITLTFITRPWSAVSAPLCLISTTSLKIVVLFHFKGRHIISFLMQTIFVATLALRAKRAHLESLGCLQGIIIKKRKIPSHVTIEQNIQGEIEVYRSDWTSK